MTEAEAKRSVNQMITKKVFGHPFETYAVTTDVTEISELKYFAAAKESKHLTFSYLLEKDDIVYGLGGMQNDRKGTDTVW